MDVNRNSEIETAISCGHIIKEALDLILHQQAGKIIAQI